MPARDKDTGAEQQITISESSNLDRGEVERMVAEAQRNQAEDQDQVDARNELDAVAYQVERQLAEGGDAIPSHERARAEMLVTDARQAIKEEAPLERLRTLTGELQQALQGLMLASSAAVAAGRRTVPAAPGRRRRRDRRRLHPQLGGGRRQAQQQPPPEPSGETATQVDEAATAALAGLEDRWRRAVADLDNLRKRYARERERERAAERGRVAAQFLPVVDNLDRALAHAGGDPGAIVEGVRRCARRPWPP